ncbi:MAG TPA: hypothetical protein VIS74_08715, partial [Chthoniobacterales bacterium]
TACAAALGVSLLALTYSKTAIMASPALAGFALYEFFRLPHDQRPSGRQLALLGLLTGWLAVLPVLPALRESRFVAYFDFAPFAGWQTAFSTKTALSWLDRDSLLTAGADPMFAPSTANAGAYLGLASLAIFAAFLYLLPTGRLAGPRVAYCRLFIALSLLMFWLSFGPSGVLFGQLKFLSFANGAPDFAIALSWLLLALPPLIIFQLIPRDFPGRRIWGVGLTLGYLLVPGFRILELLPLFHHIRAPFDFLQVTGLFCIAVAAAFCLRELLALVPGKYAAGLLATLVVVQVADVWNYTRPLRQPVMPSQVFSDFLSVQQFLKQSSRSGLVYPVSGRYFYLLTPRLSGRGLAMEAFNSYLQQRDFARLAGLASLSRETQIGLWRAIGVSWVLIDKTDPDTPEDYRSELRSYWPVAFENLNFVVLSPEGASGAPYLAASAVNLKPDQPDLVKALQFAGHEIISVPDLQDKPLPAAGTFSPIAHAASASQGYRDWTLPAPGKPGWVVLPQAWHPDWKVEQSGQWSAPLKACGGVLAAWSDGKNPLQFRFEPPAWYPLVILVSGIGWLVVLAGWLAPFRQGNPASAASTRLNFPSE